MLNTYIAHNSLRETDLIGVAPFMKCRLRKNGKETKNGYTYTNGKITIKLYT